MLIAVTSLFTLACATPEAKEGLGPGGSNAIVRLAVAPTSATMDSDAVLQYTVTAVHQDSSTSQPVVSWTATGGSIDAGGLYVAGQTPGTFAVTASLAGGSVSGSTSVTIVAPTSPVVSLAITPGTAALWTGESRQFLVTATRANGSTFAPSVTWSATGGTIGGSGMYTAGGTAGVFQVIAVLPGQGLADTSTVTLTAPVLQAVVLNPANATVYTGGSYQFSVSGQWSNGATTPPSVTYSALGGTITGGGLYTAGGTPGTYTVIATQQGGTLSDTSVVSVTQAPAGGLYPNLPANYTRTTSIDFSNAVPGGNTQADQAIPGSDSWWTIYHTGLSLISDPTAPQSPPGVWQVRYPAGTRTSGWGVGNVFRRLPNPTAIYGSIRFKVDSDYIWHPISNKFIWLTPDQVLIQSLEGSRWLHGESLDASQWLDTGPGSLNGATLVVYKNDVISKGAWHQVEFVVDKGARTFKIWLDGDLKTHATNVQFANGYFDMFSATAHRGGGGETLTRDTRMYYDHFFLAWP